MDLLLDKRSKRLVIDHQKEHVDEQNAVESEQIELNNRNSENLIPE